MQSRIKIALLLCLFFSTINIRAQQHLIDSLNNSLKTASDSSKVRNYCELSRLYLESSPILGMRNAQEALDISVAHNWNWGIADSQNRLGNVFYYATNYSKALEYYLKSLDLRLKAGDQSGIADSYNNISLIYIEFKNYDKAREYALKSISINRKLGYKQSIADNYNNLSIIAQMHEYWDSALTYLSNAVSLYKDLGDQQGMANAFSNIGDLYRSTGNLNNAISYELQALNYYQESGSLYGQAVSKINLGEMMVKKGDYSLGHQYLEEALPISIQMKGKDLIGEIHKTLSELYNRTGDYKKALDELILYHTYQESVFAKESNSKILEMQMKFETDQQIQNIKLLKNEKILQKVQMQKNKSLGIFFLSVASLLFLVVLLSNLIKQNRKNRTLLLREKNIDLYFSNQELRKSEMKLKELNQSRDKFFSIIAHDLISPFNSLLGLSELLNTDTEQLTRQEKKKYAEWILQSARNLLHLLENLLDWSGTQSGQINFTPKYIKLGEHINNVISLLSANAYEKKLLLVSEVDKDEKVFADPNMLSTILRNLIGNAIKFTSAEGSITIGSNEKATMTEICISDTGMGISSENLEKLFNFNESFSTKGTIQEEGTGLGLILCKEFVEKMGGEIRVESTPGEGSSFKFTVPSLPVAQDFIKE